MKSQKNKQGFTLIELLVVISILGILMGIVGPKVIDLLSSSEKTKMQTIVRGWVTQLHKYKSNYGYFPPFLYEEIEGVPIGLEDDLYHASFLISLKGKELTDTGWLALEEENEQNPHGKEFHSFSEDEFGSDGKLLGRKNLKILVDQNGDGIINLDPDTVNEILTSLSADYSSSDLQKIDREAFGRVKEKVIVFLLEDDDLDLANVFSWNVEKNFDF